MLGVTPAGQHGTGGLLTQGQGWLSVCHGRFAHTLAVWCWGSAGKLSSVPSSTFWQVRGAGSIVCSPPGLVQGCARLSGGGEQVKVAL